MFRAIAIFVVSSQPEEGKVSENNQHVYVIVSVIVSVIVIVIEKKIVSPLPVNSSTQEISSNLRVDKYQLWE